MLPPLSKPTRFTHSFCLDFGGSVEAYELLVYKGLCQHSVSVSDIDRVCCLTLILPTKILVPMGVKHASKFKGGALFQPAL